MIVLGADTHKRSHTIAAVAAATGELVGEKTVVVGAGGFASLLIWARGLQGERVWALEDCRHVAGSFERFLIARGERVLRVPTKLMAGARRGGRERGKSDSIDSVAVARAALREGLDELPLARLDGPELDLRLLVDHRERLVRQRVAASNATSPAASGTYSNQRPTPDQDSHTHQVLDIGAAGGAVRPSRRAPPRSGERSSHRSVFGVVTNRRPASSKGVTSVVPRRCASFVADEEDRKMERDELRLQT